MKIHKDKFPSFLDTPEPPIYSFGIFCINFKVINELEEFWIVR